MVDNAALRLDVLDPRQRPTLSVKEAASLFGVAQSTIYDAVRRGELPVIRIGRRKLLPTAALMTMVGLQAIDSPSPDSSP